MNRGGLGDDAGGLRRPGAMATARVLQVAVLDEESHRVIAYDLQGIAVDLDGDVRGSLEGSGSSVILAPSDTLEVAFKAPPQNGARTDYFVKVTGGWTVSLTKGLNSLAETVEPPRVFALHSARPNPTHASTLIRFDVPREERVAIEVFDLQGRKIRTLVRGLQPAGEHDVTWNRVTDSGVRAAPGVYLYRMVAGTYHSQRKLVLLP